MPFRQRQILLTVLAILMVIGQCAPVATACGCGSHDASTEASTATAKVTAKVTSKVTATDKVTSGAPCCSQRATAGRTSASNDNVRTCACGSRCGRGTVKCECGCGEESAPEPVRPAESTDVAKVLAHGINADSALTVAAQPAPLACRVALARPLVRRVQILLCTWQT